MADGSHTTEAAASILVVDDEEPIRDSVRRILLKEGFDVRVAESGKRGLEELRENPPSLLLADIHMAEMDGLELLKSTKMIAPETQVIMMTAYGTVESAVQAMKDGADDFLEKPLSRAALLSAINKALEKHVLVSENRLLRAEIAKHRGISNVVGRSHAMRQVLDLVAQVAPTNATVLITGETGTGKEVIARAVHHLSPRTDRPFVSVNCAALPETLIESELFGYEKGAFTDAKGRRAGRFQQAHTGTLFLDEIGDMQPHLQVKLLRALQEGMVEPLGSSRPQEVDVRILTATNRDLGAAVATGAFREDLFYRLNVVGIDLPPMRDRREDIPILVHHFIRRFADRNERRVQGIDARAMRSLQNYEWPGNVRQIENVIERAVILAPGDVIMLADLPHDIAGEDAVPEDVLHIPIGLPFEEVKSRVIGETLRRANGNKELAAKLLDISSRTIYRWMRDREEAAAAPAEPEAATAP
ncbi:sigma-54-dependent Fis family transcriptional regulator [Candidatus Poribacteria bacterium]|jgi:two-component system, NtrC family, response regulator HydG|nr:sigma-54-dependent Fis family transcriptional regulator [Candidatus Poribacteria bacterium]MBT5714445.1 sigma-54-dependent Fis family transcriptional regulator [Candidatus Poribacteria bacterium]MBT7100342.1 sigma-54-dependent Fis family transcriptional regulator [Candidatus Poribacteria bacterium]MBT7805576.1 sigma-54-dependent Fis family transcriptional regulator [Candidatus Poribacteria bacterium]